MDNVEWKLKGNLLTITLDVSKRGAVSDTGKTIRVASSCGNKPIADGSDVKVSINAYVPNPNYVK